MSQQIKFKLDPSSKKTIRKLKSLGKTFEQGLRLGLYDSGVNMERWLKADMLASKSGVKYKGSRKRSSAPGESPASQTGNLRNSIEFNVTGWDKLTFGYQVDYGKYLELGTKFIEERPGLQKSINANKGIVRNNISKRLKDELKK